VVEAGYLPQLLEVRDQIVGLKHVVVIGGDGDGLPTWDELLEQAVPAEVPRETVTPEQARAIVGAQSVKRRISADDVVGAAVFLASADADLVTGQTIVVDGGLNFL